MKNLVCKLKKYGQEHLLDFFDELSQEEQKSLLTQIDKIDFEMILKLYKNALSAQNEVEKDNTYTPIEDADLMNFSEKERAQMYNLGMNTLSQGKVAALLVAGGQGSRLGYDGPKGTFDIGLPSKKSLFELQADRLLKLCNKCGKTIPWYIMTSPENNTATVSFFEEKQYFGYDKSFIKFFEQDVLPSVDLNGKIMLASKSSIALNPNGNGGVFLSLRKSGMYQDMLNRNIQWVAFNGVDNALVKIADPYFLGYTILSEALVGSKAITKKYPSEKVGVFCYKNNHPSIVEYIKLPKEIAESTNEKGQLKYGSANIINHFLNIDFISKTFEYEIPFYSPLKKLKYVNGEGKTITPVEPNGYKFECFMFDYFELLEDMAVLKVKREEEFAPVKNAEGEDSPETARKMLMNLQEE